MNKILVPIDGSECSNMAIEKASELAKLHDSDIILLHVDDAEKEKPVVAASQTGPVPGVNNPGGAGAGPVAVSTNPANPEDSERAKKILASAKSKLIAQEDKVTTLTMHGNPADVILSYAKQSDIDLIVMGSSSKSGLKRLLLGSVADKVAKNAEQSVYIIR